MRITTVKPDRKRSAKDLLDRHYLEVRAKLLEIAATLDRFELAEGSIEDDPRSAQIHDAISILLSDGDDRAERLQLLFSLAYDPSWRDKYAI